MVGRKPKKTPEEIYELLKTYNFLDETQTTYKKFNDKIWITAASKTSLSKENIYQIITLNRNKLSERIHGIHVQQLKQKTVKEKENLNTSNWSTNGDSQLTERLRTTIDLPK